MSQMSDIQKTSFEAKARSSLDLCGLIQLSQYGYADTFYMEGNAKFHIKSDAAAAGLPDLMPKIKNGPVILE